MPERRSSQHSRAKIALIPVLGLVLFVVRLWQSDEPADTPAATPGLAATPASLRAASPGRTQGTGAAPATVEAWPDFGLEQVLPLDPFAMPGHWKSEAQSSSSSSTPGGRTPESTAADSLAALQRAIQQVRVQAIVRNGKGYSALIDGKVYRVGDDVGGQLRIAAIESKTVTFESAKSDSGPPEQRDN